VLNPGGLSTVGKASPDRRKRLVARREDQKGGERRLNCRSMLAEGLHLEFDGVPITEWRLVRSRIYVTRATVLPSPGRVRLVLHGDMNGMPANDTTARMTPTVKPSASAAVEQDRPELDGEHR
jgi:hypothetical protein